MRTPLRVAGVLANLGPSTGLHLLYAQPLVKIAALKTTAIVVTPKEMRIPLGAEPVPVPELFAGLLRHYLHNRPNLRTAGGSAGTPWLFPSSDPGKHVDPQSRRRNSAIQNLVAEVTPHCRTSRLQLPGRTTQFRNCSATIAAVRQVVVDMK